MKPQITQFTQCFEILNVKEKQVWFQGLQNGCIFFASPVIKNERLFPTIMLPLNTFV